jgi:Transposase
VNVFCGIDWAEDHHDIALVGREGQLLARRRISDDAAGLAALLDLLAGHGDHADDLIPVAIETPRGLLTSCLRATGRAVYPINPMAVARYRDRHSVAGRKSDHGDAIVLANILRTDAHAHRPLPGDTELAQTTAVLARAQQDAVWARTAAHNKLRSHLREYYPGFLATFADARGGISRPGRPGHPGRRAHPRCGRQADQLPAPGAAQAGRPQTRRQRRSHPAARGLPGTADAPAPAGRGSNGPPDPGTAPPARCRLRERR